MGKEVEASPTSMCVSRWISWISSPPPRHSRVVLEGFGGVIVIDWLVELEGFLWGGGGGRG